jgi:hypothetical protein
VPGAKIELMDGADHHGGGGAATSCTVWSDSSGQYVADHIAPGTVTMQITHPGFDTLSVQVAVAPQGIVRLNVSLAPELVVLDSVRVPGIASARSSAPVIDNGANDAGDWRWRGSPADAAGSTSDPDVFRVLDGDPTIAMRPEWPAALMDRGGPAGQVLVRVDGLPIWNPVHAGASLAAIPPDAVASVTLHDGSLPAAFGDRLAAVVDIGTRDSIGGASSGIAALGPDAARAAWTAPLAIGGAQGSVLVSGRVSDAGVSTLEPAAAGFRDRWGDGLATASLASGPTSIRVVAVGSGDQLRPDDELVPDRSIRADMRTPWQTLTAGLVWAQILGDHTPLVTRISSAAFSATVPGQLGVSAPTLESGVHQLEGSTQLSVHRTTLGADADVLAVRYHVTPDDADAGGATAGTGASALALGDGGRRPLDLRGEPVLVGAFAEHVWGPGDSAWQITTGLRGAVMTGTTPRIEPRLAGTLRLAPGVIASAGLARTHQYVQSLRDPDSPYGAQIGLDLPAAAGMGGMPIAQSDAATAGISTQVATVARLTVNGFARRLSGLAVVSPAHPDAFAVYGFDRGSGRVTGGGVELDGVAGRFTWQTAYGLGTTVERFDAVRYHPAGEIGQALFAAAGVQLGHATELRVANWIASGQRPGSLDALPGGRDADDDGAAPGARDTDDDGGTAATTPGDHGLPGALASPASLPPYMRADIQLRREWRVGPGSGHMSTFVTLANALNHGNIAAFLPRELGAPLRAIVLLPRSLLAGMSWAY